MKDQPDQAAVPLGVATDSPLASSPQSNAGPTASPPEELDSAALRITILNSLPSQVVVVDAAGGILSFNKSWRDFWLVNTAVSSGAPRGIEIGDNFLAVFGERPGHTPEDSTLRVAQGIRAVLGGRLTSFEADISCDTPTQKRWSLMSATALSPSGQGAVIAYTDITERKQMEEAIRSRDARQGKMVANIGDVIVIIDHEGINRYKSPNVEKLFGWRPEELVGVSALDKVHPDDLDSAGKFVGALLGEPNAIATTECRYRCKDGSYRWIEFIGVNLLHDPDIRGILGNYRDITERKQIEALNRQLQKSESLGRMAGAVAHHFNNQLQVVTLSLELAAINRPSKAGSGDDLSAAMRATRKAAEVSSQMLIYLGQSSASHEPLNLAETCQQSLALLKSTLPPSAALETDLPSPGPCVHANASQIKQVLMNFITNAWESSGDGRGAIRLSVKTASATEILAADHFPLDWQPQAAAYAGLEVADKGTGITAAEIQNIFDPFYSTKFAGRGLGLSVVLGIMRSHDGVVTVQSEPGRGSVFRAFFPALTEVVPAKLVPVQLAPAPSNGGCRTVLLVEDEPALRETLALALESFDFTVLAAGDGVEAMELFRQHRDEIDCVLCDVAMPRMDGWATLAALRRLAPDLPVILASGYDESQVMQGDHPERPQAFLKKPFDLNACINTVRLLTTSPA